MMNDCWKYMQKIVILIHTEFFRNFKCYPKMKPEVSSFLVYGGNEYQTRTDATVLGFKQLDEIQNA